MPYDDDNDNDDDNNNNNKAFIPYLSWLPAGMPGHVLF